MAHGIYLSAKNDSEGFRLPVNPPSVEVQGSGNNEEYTIAGLGTVNVPGYESLDVYPIESYFPKHPTHLSVAEHVDPQTYIDHLNKWKKEKLPVRYIYVDGSFAINELTMIEQFEYGEFDGSGDVNFTLSLKKHVPSAPKKMALVKKATATKPATVAKKSAPPTQNAKVTPKTYSLIKGDSLWKLAQKFLGSGTRYPEIQKLNGIKDSQLRKLPIGLKVKIPPK